MEWPHHTVDSVSSPAPNIEEYEGARGAAMPTLQLAQATARGNYPENLARGVKTAVAHGHVAAGRGTWKNRYRGIVTYQKRRKWALEVAGRSYWAREKITKDSHHFEKWAKVSIDRAGILESICGGI